MCLAPLAPFGGPVGARGRPGCGWRRSRSSPGAGARHWSHWSPCCLGAGGPELRPGRSSRRGAFALHPQGPVISQFLNAQLDRILVHRVAYYAGLHRVTPEWPKVAPSPPLRPPSWRRPTFEQANPHSASYHNFEPAQWRSERQRHYTCTARKCRSASRPRPRQVAGAPPARAALRRCCGRLNVHGTVAPAPKQARSGSGIARRTMPSATTHQHRHKFTNTR